MSIDAIKLHGRADMSYKLGMGVTKGVYKAERIMNTSSSNPAKWGPAVIGLYRYIRVRANPQNDELAVCELKVNGYPRTPHYRVITGIAMSNSPVRTASNVVSVIECASICLQQTDPVCMATQYNQVTKSCALFGDLEHTKDSSNLSRTVVFKFAAHAFANMN
ncbi:uncharacterized protein LOC127848077 [Dreissena polymorpha]|nr:uncharacterized protein LOC127848077 [Dreissena polymorpha]